MFKIFMFYVKTAKSLSLLLQTIHIYLRFRISTKLTKSFVKPSITSQSSG